MDHRNYWEQDTPGPSLKGFLCSLRPNCCRHPQCSQGSQGNKIPGRRSEPERLRGIIRYTYPHVNYITKHLYGGLSIQGHPDL